MNRAVTEVKSWTWLGLDLILGTSFGRGTGRIRCKSEAFVKRIVPSSSGANLDEEVLASTTLVPTSVEESAKPLRVLL